MPESAIIGLSLLLGARGAWYLWIAYRWSRERKDAQALIPSRRDRRG